MVSWPDNRVAIWGEKCADERKLMEFVVIWDHDGRGIL